MNRKKENKIRKLEKVALRYLASPNQTSKVQRLVKGLVTRIDNIKKS